MVLFHSETDFNLTKKTKIKRWIKECVLSENYILGDINYIFCDDQYLLERNIQYLNHDTLTDIITFNNCEDNVISGDIMISIERIKENSITFANNFSQELKRVMIHGVLHLIGYNDLTNEEKKIIREKEDFYLNIFDN